ncbi:DUF2933 domain-containing protein [Ramlibacter sp. AN1015]|uniref:DUF2933 domain-containing protein n=1 Tax=Ramlibacter sp. AN1015 TaxID=3133428 RepID=UPI0030C10E20
MKCNLKVMLSVAAVMAAAAGFAYLTFEEARIGIVASLPVLAALLCPVSMLVMMKMMHSGSKESQCAAKSESATPPAAEPVQLAKESK